MSSDIPGLAETAGQELNSILSKLRGIDRSGVWVGGLGGNQLLHFLGMKKRLEGHMAQDTD